ncbi:MAG: hypothetical protein J7K89_08700 [Candidatus Cloacimonetes bacterium]|nr:hypothetical protein [Candidatus Cloacimonadota bacterium]
MKKKIKAVVNVISWLVVWFAFGSLGFASENPRFGVPFFLIVFLAAFIGCYLYLRFHQRREEPNRKLIAMMYRAFGVVLCLMVFIVPLRMLPTIIGESIVLSFFNGLLIVVGLAVLLAIAILAINIINNAKGKNFLPTLLGYIILIAVSSVPALVVSKYSGTYDALGRTYWMTLTIAILAWWGLSLVGTKEA